MKCHSNKSKIGHSTGDCILKERESSCSRCNKYWQKQIDWVQN